MTRTRRPEAGDVVQIALPDGRFAYGRVLRDAALAVYRAISRGPNDPPTGSRDYQFVVGVDDHALAGLPVVGHDPSANPDDDFPPPFSITDPITGDKAVYHRGRIRPDADGSRTEGLEPAAVWELEHLISRIEGSRPRTS